MSQTTQQRRLRPPTRTVLAVGPTALALIIGTASLAGAAAGDPWRLGMANTSEPTTYLNWDKATYPVPEASLVVHGGDVGAVFGNAEYWPESYPTSLTGVAGYGNDIGGFFFGVDSGVQAKGWYEGLHAEALEGGTGVTAIGDYGVTATGDDVGLAATGPTALQATGGVSFSTAGLATVRKGAKAVTVPAGVDVGPQTKVLATVQSSGGQLLRARRNAAADTVTMLLTKAATQDVVVAYFVML